VKRILVTGPDGFVGSALCAALVKHGYAVRGAQWRPAPLPPGCDSVSVGDIGSRTDWAPALNDVDAVVHLAARVPLSADTPDGSLAEFHEVNVNGTRSLAEAAVGVGVRRLILMSSIKVNGESTPPTVSAAFTEADAPAPEDAYGTSKLEAERVLLATARPSTMETVVLRAPLIYGRGVKGNFARLLKLADSGLPMPFGAVRNRRSLLYLGNLVDVIVQCIEHPAAANEMFVLSDGEDLSTADLLREIRRAMGRPPRLVPVPSALFHFVGRITGKSSAVARLLEWLVVDSRKVRAHLGWHPPYSVRQGLAETVKGR
jgi:nucleoside-diphosphate-sugar epimerase